MPTIFGTNKNEGTLFSPAVALMLHSYHLPPSDEDVYNGMVHILGGEPGGGNNATAVAGVVPIALKAYPKSDYTNSWARLANLLTEYFFLCGTRRSALALQAAGIPVWTYHFTFPIPTLEGWILGTYHGSEVQYVFEDKKNPNANEQVLYDTFGWYWSNLAYYGDPNGDGSNADARPPNAPNWPQFGTEAAYTHLNITVPASLEHNYRMDKCSLFDKYWDITNGW